MICAQPPKLHKKTQLGVGVGVKWPHRISLRGSDNGFSGRGKTSRTLAHTRKSHSLQRAQWEGFFYPQMKIHPSRGSNSQHTGCQPANVAAWASHLRQPPKLHNIGIVRSTPISKKTLTIISQKASIFQPNSTQLVRGVLEDLPPQLATNLLWIEHRHTLLS